MKPPNLARHHSNHLHELFYSGGGGKTSFPSPSAGDLRELPRVPLSPTLTSIHDCWKNHSFDCMDLCWQSDVFVFYLSKISSHKTTHANGYYGAWPGWAVSISVLPLTLLAVRQTRTWDPLQQCCHACIWTSLSLSNKVQRNYMGATP